MHDAPTIFQLRGGNASSTPATGRLEGLAPQSGAPHWLVIRDGFAVVTHRSHIFAEDVTILRSDVPRSEIPRPHAIHLGHPFGSLDCSSLTPV